MTAANEPQGAAFADLLKQARHDAGLSRLNATFGLRGLLPRSYWVSDGTLVRLENGTISEAEADWVIVAALAKLYGVTMDSFGPEAKEAHELIVSLFEDDGWAARDSNPEPAESLPEAA